MSDKVSLAETLSDTSNACARFLEETLAHPDKRLWQTAAVADGLLVGGIKAIPDQVFNHTSETTVKAVLGASIGFVLGAANKIKNPRLAAGLAVTGVGMTCGYVWDLGQRLSQDERLNRALDKLWQNPNQTAFTSVVPQIEKSLGKESFDLALGTVVGGASYHLPERLMPLTKWLCMESLRCVPAQGPHVEMTVPKDFGEFCNPMFIKGKMDGAVESNSTFTTAVEAEGFSNPWISFQESEPGVFRVVANSMTNDLRPELGFKSWAKEVGDLDNGWSDEASCFGMSNHLKWRDVDLTPDVIKAPSFLRLQEALKFIKYCAWDPGDV